MSRLIHTNKFYTTVFLKEAPFQGVSHVSEGSCWVLYQYSHPPISTFMGAEGYLSKFSSFVLRETTPQRPKTAKKDWQPRRVKLLSEALALIEKYQDDTRATLSSHHRATTRLGPTWNPCVWWQDWAKTLSTMLPGICWVPHRRLNSVWMAF